MMGSVSTDGRYQHGFPVRYYRLRLATTSTSRGITAVRGEDFRHFGLEKALWCVSLLISLKVEQLGCGAEALVGEECSPNSGSHR